MIWIDLQHKKPTDTDIPGWQPWSQQKWDEWLAGSARLVGKLAELQAAGDVVGRNKFIDDNSAHWGKLKPWLRALSYGKCWFSEAKELYSHYEIEHFRPKKEAKALDGTIRDGYWWLAFDYMNFRVCGNVGNRKKGGWFPLQEGSLQSIYENRCEESETNYLLDPIDNEDVNLLAFDEEGKAVPAPGVSEWEICRVAETVKRLKLNEHIDLTEARRKIWTRVSGLIEQYNDAKSRCKAGGNPAARERVRNVVSQVKEMMQPTSELSSVARWCILLRNDPQLSRLLP
jgi:uncharacterized protein (TIGR02646 family)